MTEAFPPIAIWIALALGAFAGIVLLVVATTVAYSLWLPANYLLIMIMVLRARRPVSELDEEIGLRPSAKALAHPDHQVALPSYFFGPAVDDVRYVTEMAVQRCRSSFGQGASLASEAAKVDAQIVRIIGGVGIRAGLLTGGFIGILLTIVVVIAHVAATAVTVLVAVCIGYLLLTIDGLKRFIWNVQMTCPACAEEVTPYPGYKCPRCGELHRDIRSGRLGITSRICKCGGRLPTSLLMGAYRLGAVCPRCGAELPPKFGSASEIVLPFFGGGNVGKTQLMYTLVLALCKLAADSGGTVELVGDTGNRIDKIAAFITATGNSGKTVATPPKAHVLHLKLGANDRLIYLFDAAGELHYRKDSLEELAYLGKSRTFVFVVDPLAADGLWEQFSDEQQGRLVHLRSNISEAELAYHQTREQMRRTGRKRNFARLAFVVSKADLLTGTLASLGPARAPIREWVRSQHGLDMGDVVREATQSFSTVEFFETAAVTDDAGLPDASVETLARWLMWSEGVRLGGR